MQLADSAVALTVNGQAHALSVPAQASLLNVLRNDLQLNSPKYGCGLGECGACTVLVDGVAARACVIPARGVAGRCITTLEGLGALLIRRDLFPPVRPEVSKGSRSNHSEPIVKLHPIQQAFIDEQAAQCGYCTSGMILMTASLLAHTPQPTEAQIRNELSGNLCRCGTHVEIVKAVQRAVVLMQVAQAS
jgi:nicotinate dehydrogenase subunit A